MKKTIICAIAFVSIMQTVGMDSNKSKESKIRYVHNQCRREYFGGPILEPWEHPQCFGSRIEAESGKSVVGSIQFFEHPQCKIELLSVDNDQQGKGIGKELFHQAVEQMYRSGCGRVKWYAVESAVKFYEKQGAIKDRGTNMSIDPKNLKK